ncbi:MAG: replication and repair protein RecF [Bacillota bacterium]|nr:replication and repair protein RecF [Bacillota bacterium]
MLLKLLTLADFRNWATLEWQPAPGLNVITGANAEGKSNLLEAIFFLASGKSFRTHRDADLARFGSSGFAVGARIERRAGELSLVLRWDRARGKTLTLDRTEHPRLADLFGQVTAVCFSPEDLSLVKGPPEVRRHALNLLLLQVSRPYYYHLREYNRVLAQRNAYLKRLPPTASSELALAVWDEELALHGAELILRRHAALAELARWADERHRELSGGHELRISYVPSVPLSEPATLAEAKAAFLQELEQKRREELRRGITLSGPQRDEINFSIGGRDLRSYGSQGEQRTAALAWKLAELEFIRAHTGEMPLLLLDDVYSELDPKRQAYLTREARRGSQTFLTSAEDLELAFPDAASWRVAAGELKPH